MVRSSKKAISPAAALAEGFRGLLDDIACDIRLLRRLVPGAEAGEIGSAKREPTCRRPSQPFP